MAKKREIPTEPKVSSIPVPPSDSALVIDLPDGQKLLVGKIETGTVIEVATWRGTGRPDSRTNRLMLGMSSENDIKDAEVEESLKPDQAKNLKFPNNLAYFIVRFGKQLIEMAKKVFSRVTRFLRSLDLKKMKEFKSSFSGFKITKAKNLQEIDSAESRKSLRIEEDFDIDFQRILDEVNQRRAGVPNKPPRGVNKSSSIKGSNQKRSDNSKKSPKKRSR